MIYKLVKFLDGSINDGCIIQQDAPGNEPFDPTRKIIPKDPSNKDYQEYLKWLAEGNQPLPADE